MIQGSNNFQPTRSKISNIKQNTYNDDEKSAPAQIGMHSRVSLTLIFYFFKKVFFGVHFFMTVKE